MAEFFFADSKNERVHRVEYRPGSTRAERLLGTSNSGTIPNVGIPDFSTGPATVPRRIHRTAVRSVNQHEIRCPEFSKHDSREPGTRKWLKQPAAASARQINKSLPVGSSETSDNHKELRNE
jgi:hypothetical protein